MRYCSREESVRNEIASTIISAAVKLNESRIEADPALEQSEREMTAALEEDVEEIWGDGEREERGVPGGGAHGLESATLEVMDLDNGEESYEDNLNPPRRDIRMEVTQKLDVYPQQPITKNDSGPLVYWTNRQDIFP